MSLLRHITLALLLLTAAPAWAEELHGLIVAIHDGDTLTILTAERQQGWVRLAEIDTPESRQPYGTRARQALAAMVARQDARVVVVDIDRYGRRSAGSMSGPWT
jgi:endonuclease YncB( thermonuclease family)